MNEEQLMVLKLLEEGKITQKEAEMLLEALGTASSHSKQGPGKEANTGQTRQEQEEQSEKYNQNLDDKFEHYTRQFGKRMAQLGTEIADKSITFAEKMVGMIENLVDNGNFQWDIQWDGGRGETFEEVLEFTPDAASPLSLNFSTVNNKLTLEPWEENYIQVKALIRTPYQQYQESNPILIMKQEGQELTFLPRRYDHLSMQLFAYLPNRIYDAIRLDNHNGSIYAQGLACRNLYSRTKNAGIQLASLKIESELACSSANGKIILEHVYADTVAAATKNSKIGLQGVSTGRIDLLTTNSKIYLSGINYLPLNYIKLETSNGSISIEDPLPQRSVEAEAATTNGKIRFAPALISTDRISSPRHQQRFEGKRIIEGSDEPVLTVKAYTTNANINLFV